MRQAAFGMPRSAIDLSAPRAALREHMGLLLSGRTRHGTSLLALKAAG